jgi:hypothetical protein
MSNLGRFGRTIGALAIVAIMFMAVPLTSAGTPPSPPSPPSGWNSWAYGHQWVWNCNSLSCLGDNNSTITSTANYTVSFGIHIFLGIDVIYSELNTTSGASLEVYRAAVAVAFVQFSVTDKVGSAAGTSASINVSAEGYAVATGYANITTSTVLVNGTTSVPAYALVNAASNEQSNYTLSMSSSVSGTLASDYSAALYASMGLQAYSSVSFTPALSFVPTNPTPLETWTSNSSYAALGNLAGALHYYYSIPEMVAGDLNSTSPGCPAPSNQSGNNCVLSHTASASGSLTGSGFLDLIGSDLGPVTINLPGGTSFTAQVISIETTGPYGFADGIMLLPNSMFSGSGPGGIPVGIPGGSLGSLDRTMATTTTSGDQMVFNPSASHFGVVGETYGSLPGQSATQTLPESTSTALSTAQTNLNMVKPSSSSSGGIPIMLILIVVVVAVVVVVAAAMWVGRKKKRPTSAQTAPVQPQANPQQNPQYQTPPPPPPQQGAYPPARTS